MKKFLGLILISSLLVSCESCTTKNTGVDRSIANVATQVVQNCPTIQTIEETLDSERVISLDNFVQLFFTKDESGEYPIDSQVCQATLAEYDRTTCAEDPHSAVCLVSDVLSETKSMLEEYVRLSPEEKQKYRDSRNLAATGIAAGAAATGAGVRMVRSNARVLEDLASVFNTARGMGSPLQEAQLTLSTGKVRSLELQEILDTDNRFHHVLGPASPEDMKGAQNTVTRYNRARRITRAGRILKPFGLVLSGLSIFSLVKTVIEGDRDRQFERDTSSQLLLTGLSQETVDAIMSYYEDTE